MKAEKVTSLMQLKRRLTVFQSTLLDEIWRCFLATSEWPISRALHSRHSKASVTEALLKLGGSIVYEMEDRAKGGRYALSAIGVLLTRDGERYREILVGCLGYFRELYLSAPEKLQVTDAEIAAAVKLDAAELKVLGKLIALPPLYLSAGAGPTNWSATIPKQVEDFSKTGELGGELDSILLKNFSLSEPVYLEARRSASKMPVFPDLFGAHQPLINAPAGSTAVDALKRRYQVFVSSTFEDLKAERQHVMQALLETKCIPTGMELFPATSSEQWELIKRVIDECDYYLVIVAGRYGTTNERGISYTEREFDYAVEIGKPVIGFYHREPGSIPGSKLESADKARARLRVFTKKVKGTVCRPWVTPDELGSAVKSAILHELEFNPKPGWIRADAVPTSDVVEKLKQRVADLEEQLKRPARKTPVTQDGDRQVEIAGKVQFGVKTGKKVPELYGDGWREQVSYRTVPFAMRKTWNELLLLFSDKLKFEVSQEDLQRKLEQAAAEAAESLVVQKSEGKADSGSFSMPSEYFDRLLSTLVDMKLVRVVSNRWGGQGYRLAPAGIARVAKLKAL